METINASLKLIRVLNLHDRLSVIRSIHGLFESTGDIEVRHRRFSDRLTKLVNGLRMENVDVDQLRAIAVEHFDKQSTRPYHAFCYDNVASANTALVEFLMFDSVKPHFTTQFKARMTHNFGKLIKFLPTALVHEASEKAMVAFVRRQDYSLATLRQLLYMLYAQRSNFDGAESTYLDDTRRIIRQIPKVPLQVDGYSIAWLRHVAHFNGGRFGDDECIATMQRDIRIESQLVQDMTPLAYYYDIVPGDIVALKAKYEENLSARNSGASKNLSDWDQERILRLERFLSQNDGAMCAWAME